MRGFRTCVVPLYAERVDAARAVLAKHDCVDPESIRYDGYRLTYRMDLARIGEGDGPCVEQVIATEINGGKL